MEALIQLTPILNYIKLIRYAVSLSVKDCANKLRMLLYYVKRASHLHSN
jgi:hypothetical protein